MEQVEAGKRPTWREFRSLEAMSDASVEDAVALIRKGTALRVVFAVLMALVATAILPLALCAAWAAFMAAWEFWIRP